MQQRLLAAERTSRRRTRSRAGRRSSPRCSCTARSSTSPATCCSCGSSATTSRTRWARSSSSLFYIVGGLAALGLQIAVEPGLDGADDRRLRGDRGGARRLHRAVPRARVLTLVFIILFFTVIELPALVMLGIWFAEQALFGAVNLTNPAGGGGGVAYFAHVGGFVFGLIAIRALATQAKARASPLPGVLSGSRRRPRDHARVHRRARALTVSRLRQPRRHRRRRVGDPDPRAVRRWHRRGAARILRTSEGPERVAGGAMPADGAHAARRAVVAARSRSGRAGRGAGGRGRARVHGAAGRRSRARSARRRRRRSEPGRRARRARRRVGESAGARNPYGTALAPAVERFHVKLHKRLRSGLVFDVDSGRVLWERDRRGRCCRSPA